jgi:hypothetical protein
VERQLLGAGRQPPTLLQPADQALDSVSLAVDFLIESGIRDLVLARRDEELSAAIAHL